MFISLDIYFIDRVIINGWERRIGTHQEDQNEAFEELEASFPKDDLQPRESSTEMSGPKRIEIVLEALKNSSTVGPSKVVTIVATGYIPPNETFPCHSFRGRLRSLSGVLETDSKVFNCSDWRVKEVHKLLPSSEKLISHYFGMGTEAKNRGAESAQGDLADMEPAELKVVQDWRPGSTIDADNDWEGDCYMMGESGVAWHNQLPQHYSQVGPQVVHFRVQGDDSGRKEFQEYLLKMKEAGLEREPLADYVKRTSEAESAAGSDEENDEDAGISSPTQPTPKTTEPEEYSEEDLIGMGITMGPVFH